MKATIKNIRIARMVDTDPDLSWLDQFENSADPEEMEYYGDQERKAEYGCNWHMIGIKAKAEILIPAGTSYKHLETISSGGLWGIESDSDEAYFLEVGKDELVELKVYLETLCVDLSNWNELTAAPELTYE